MEVDREIRSEDEARYIEIGTLPFANPMMDGTCCDTDHGDFPQVFKTKMAKC